MVDRLQLKMKNLYLKFFKMYKELVPQRDYLLTSDSPKLEYVTQGNKEPVLEFGQLKLLATLIQFLTRYWRVENGKYPTLVYAGAAPGNNLALIAQLFPEIDLHLYDPAPFDMKSISSTDKITLYQEYFTDETAQKWRSHPNVFFVSDIRTGDYQDHTSPQENEAMVEKNMQDQLRWWNIMQPVVAQLKFRPPYAYDFILQRSEIALYPAGLIYFQPFTKAHSTETRLVLQRDAGQMSIKIKDYDSQLSYHNRIKRLKERYQLSKDLRNGEYFDSQEETRLLLDYDGALWLNILLDYLEHRSGDRVYDRELLISLHRYLVKSLLKGKSLQSKRIENKREK